MSRAGSEADCREAMRISALEWRRYKRRRMHSRAATWLESAIKHRNNSRIMRDLEARDDWQATRQAWGLVEDD